MCRNGFRTSRLTVKNSLRYTFRYTKNIFVYHRFHNFFSNFAYLHPSSFSCGHGRAYRVKSVNLINGQASVRRRKTGAGYDLSDIQNQDLTIYRSHAIISRGRNRLPAPFYFHELFTERNRRCGRGKHPRPANDKRRKELITVAVICPYQTKCTVCNHFRPDPDRDGQKTCWLAYDQKAAAAGAQKQNNRKEPGP